MQVAIIRSDDRPETTPVFVDFDDLPKHRRLSYPNDFPSSSAVAAIRPHDFVEVGERQAVLG